MFASCLKNIYLGFAWMHGERKMLRKTLCHETNVICYQTSILLIYRNLLASSGLFESPRMIDCVYMPFPLLRHYPIINLEQDGIVAYAQKQCRLE